MYENIYYQLSSVKGNTVRKLTGHMWLFNLNRLKHQVLSHHYSNSHSDVASAPQPSVASATVVPDGEGEEGHPTKFHWTWEWDCDSGLANWGCDIHYLHQEFAPDPPGGKTFFLVFLPKLYWIRCQGGRARGNSELPLQVWVYSQENPFPENSFRL